MLSVVTVMGWDDEHCPSWACARCDSPSGHSWGQKLFSNQSDQSIYDQSEFRKVKDRAPKVPFFASKTQPTRHYDWIIIQTDTFLCFCHISYCTIKNYEVYMLTYLHGSLNMLTINYPEFVALMIVFQYFWQLFKWSIKV